MASTVITYSKKKKNFFPLIGLRQRTPASAATETTPRAFAGSNSTPILGSPQFDTPRGIPHHHDSVDEMASALLDSTMDDPTDSSPSSGLIPFPKLQTDGNFLHYGSEKDGPPYQPSSTGQVAGGPHQLSHRRRPSRPRVEKSSPAAPRNTSNRRNKGSGSYLRGDIANGLTRPLPKSQTCIHPLSQNQAQHLASASASIRSLARLEEHLPAIHQPKPTDYQDINRKMELMLAATKALKPSPVARGKPPTGPLPSMMSRLKTTKVFAKVSNAFHSISSPRDMEPTAPAANATSSGSDNACRAFPKGIPALQLLENASPIASLELRLNEGHNLNKKKVQKMMGGHIPRKPLPDDGKSLKSCKSSDDPFSEPMRFTQTPTPFEFRVRDTSRNESYVLPLPTSNPFESERVLESHPDSFLHSPPLASSTPRSSIRRIRYADNSPVKRGDRRPGNIGIHRAGTAQRRLPHPRARGSPLSPNLDRIVSAKRNAAPKRSLSKKHPSPSKLQLEVLSTHLRTHPELLRPAADESPRMKEQSSLPARRLTTYPVLSPTTNEDGPEEFWTTPRSSPYKSYRGGFEARLRSARHGVGLGKGKPPLYGADEESDDFTSGSSRYSQLLYSNASSPAEKRFKKHPSPSMRDLEVLDLQLRQCQLLSGATREDMDELAGSPLGSLVTSRTTSAISTRAPSQKTRGLGRLTVDPTRATGSEATREPGRLTTKTRRRSPRLSPRPDGRLAVQFHAAPRNPSDINELQWDTPRYRLGRAAEVH